MNATREMPRYQSHKIVHALQIVSIVQAPADRAHPGGSWLLYFFEDGYAPIEVSHEWYAKHNPQRGGYLVIYKDGYRSYSPAHAFETGYARIDLNGPVTDAEIAQIASSAPRVTPAHIQAEVLREHYFVAGDGVYGAARKAGDESAQEFGASMDLLTFCVLELKNGFTVTGESACASPENFDASIGRRLAREKAVDKLWLLLGFRLRDQQHQRERSNYDPKVDAMDGGRLG